ncbi:hypothetical protein ONZ45_g1337 [Pleurotus djamor]|nr:hypothetical protein ONZ45_g1337 [Pleurotus djamor]
MSASPSPGPSTSTHRHALTAVEKQKNQLEKLLKDPSKPAYVPPPPKEKTIRAPREMMKNIQGSSAGAGSGEFHVYKASRRREYERLKLIEDANKSELEKAEFEAKRKEAEAIAEAKTSKNRAKRQKKKDRAKGKAQAEKPSESGTQGDNNAPIKKRRLVNGKELVFRKPGEESEDDGADDSADEADGPNPPTQAADSTEQPLAIPVRVVEEPRIIIHEDD